MLERRRYVGPYGRRHSPARIDGVGYLYYLEVVELDREKKEIRFERAGVPPTALTQEGLAKLFGEEFESADDYCTHKKADGRTCEAKRVPGTVLCQLHGMLAADKAPDPSDAPPFPDDDDDGYDEPTLDGPPPLGIVEDDE